MTLLLPLLAFLFVGGIIMIFGYRRYVVAGRTYENLDAPAGPIEPVPGDACEFGGFSNFSLARLAQLVAGKLASGRISAPSSATADLEMKLLAGGYRQPNALAVLYGLKLIGMGATALALMAIEWNAGGAPAMRALEVAVGAMAGFRLPDYVLATRVTRRKKQLCRALPDALDLIIVCAEAGLTIERSFRVVSTQLATVHRELCEELNLFTAEVSAGLRRKEALENLAIRTQEPEIRKFVGVVMQADRFGTSVGEALRAHADYMRTRRRQIAEEKAAKVGVKMIFPIFFFIMPCMMLVTVGPAVLIIVKELVPALTGKH